ncbi:hypothetical protein D3880_19155 [Pseudomonas cavernae]|uniref:Lipoprotein n=1 Tax=Pseudomonas cavernae TaxID=2320867 RepID=A0A385Z9J6_9PSED|nr:hypothetical protein [Pseudomonas cavernae]AYC34352.1 hypothetical protein D3880_19155 [Pseudomonas cavernae]
MRRHALFILFSLLAGCQTTHDYLLAQGYPPAFADGYQAGCNSGHQAAGAISGAFQKDVPRYLAETQYASGWDDGFRQCQAMAESAERRDYERQRGDPRDEDGQRDQDRALSKALRGS